MAQTIKKEKDELVDAIPYQWDEDQYDYYKKECDDMLKQNRFIPNDLRRMIFRPKLKRGEVRTPKLDGIVVKPTNYDNDTDL